MLISNKVAVELTRRCHNSDCASCPLSLPFPCPFACSCEDVTAQDWVKVIEAIEEVRKGISHEAGSTATTEKVEKHCMLSKYLQERIEEEANG